MAKQYAHEGPERVEIQNGHFVTVVWDGGKVFKRVLMAKEGAYPLISDFLTIFGDRLDFNDVLAVQFFCGRDEEGE
jgi:hypothetical protein